MSSNSSWVPDESPQTLFSERCWLQGTIVSSITYGINVALYFMSLHRLVHAKNRMAFKNRFILPVYITALFLSCTIFMVSLAASTQMAFIDDRNYPGGPNAFQNYIPPTPIGEAGNGAFALSYGLSDVLVVWRFRIIYKSCRLPTWIVMFFPYLLVAGSGAMGILLLIQLSSPNPYVTTGNTTNFILPYFSLVLALNIILTVAIVLRLLHFRYRIASVMGPKYGSQYTSIAAMLIESAALYSVVSIAFVVLFAIGNAVSQVFLQSLIQFQTIASLLIVFRVAQGKGWTDESITLMTAGGGGAAISPELNQVHFASPPTSLPLTRGTGGETLRSDATGDFHGCIDRDIPSDTSPSNVV